jgi:uncharacterized protein
MRPFWALGIYLTAVFLGGALLAPCLFWGADAAGWLDNKGAPAFHRFVNRSILFVALAGLWPLARASRIDSWRAVGLGWMPGWRRDLTRGFLAGLFSLGLIAGAALIVGARTFVLREEPIALAIASAIGTAAVVSVLEELLFRGVIFGTLRQVYHWTIALLASSALYSIVHFFRKPALPQNDVQWNSGLQLLPEMLQGFIDPGIVPGIFVLLLAGCILALSYQRRGALYYSIGLHAGWIFWLKSYGLLTRGQRGATETFWGTSKMIDGWFAVIVLAAMLLFLSRKRPLGGALPDATLGNIEAARRAHTRERAAG